MKRRTPREKKNLEYTKDHVVLSEYIHRFRRSWPRKKAHAARAYRRQVRQRLAVLEGKEGDMPDSLRPETVKRRLVRKWKHTVVPRGTVVERHNEDRLLSATKSFFWHAYNKDRDRSRFASLLASQIGGRTKNSRMLALYFKQLMDHPNEGRWAPQEWLSEKGQKWLRAFFQDEPEWEERVRAWIASFEEK